MRGVLTNYCFEKVCKSDKKTPAFESIVTPTTAVKIGLLDGYLHGICYLPCQMCVFQEPFT